MTNENTHIRLDQDLTNQMTVNKNLSQEIIVTNTDKVTILLNEHHKIVKKKTEWLSPVGIFITVLATLLTAKFEESFGINPELWKAIFIVVCFLALGLSVYFIWTAIYYWNRGTLEEFITKLKNQNPSTVPTTTTITTQASGIIIHSARYGAKDKFVDVTNRVIEMVLKNNSEIKASNDLVDGKDPILDTLKQLIIECTVDGERKNVIIIEGATHKWD